MNNELKKRIFTSILLISLLAAMYLYSFMMIIALIIIAIIVWIELYALISKIFPKNRLKDRFNRLLYKTISLLYLSLLVCFIFAIESNYINLKVISVIWLSRYYRPCGNSN